MILRRHVHTRCYISPHLAFVALPECVSVRPRRDETRYPMSRAKIAIQIMGQENCWRRGERLGEANVRQMIDNCHCSATGRPSKPLGAVGSRVRKQDTDTSNRRALLKLRQSHEMS